MVGIVAIVDMAVDVSFDPLSRRDNVPKLLRVDQPTGKMQRITTQSRIVMSNDDRWLCRQAVQGRGEPSQLLGSDRSLRDHRFLQRIEQKEVSMSRRDNGDMSRRDWRLGRLLVLQDLIEDTPVIVVSQGQMSIDAGVLKRIDQLCKVPIVTRLAILECQIAIDQHAGWLGRSVYQFVDNLAQMTGDRRILRLFFTDVRIVQQIDKIGVDSVCLRRGSFMPIQQDACSRGTKETPSIQSG